MQTELWYHGDAVWTLRSFIVLLTVGFAVKSAQPCRQKKVLDYCMWICKTEDA